MMHRNRNRLFQLLGPGLTLISLVLGGPTALAAQPLDVPALSIKKVIADSDAVFHGKVVAVEYRQSSDNIPHTFVTYQVLSLVSGYAEPRTTLRFIGGTDGRGAIFHFGDAPMFNVADEDILFVRGNERSPCPLVNCSRGRLRIREGYVYDTAGAALLVNADDNLQVSKSHKVAPRPQSFPTPAFDELIKNPDVAKRVAAMIRAGDTLDNLRNRYRAEAPASITYAATDGVAESKAPQKAATQSAHVDEVRALLGRLAQRSDGYQNRTAVRNANPQRTFDSGLELTPVSLPKITDDYLQQRD